jgi:hypothetical protein
MTLTEFEKRRIDRLLDDFARRRVPSELKDQIRLGWRFRADSVTLWEARPVLSAPARWSESKIARFRRGDGGDWVLDWPDRNGRWHAYEGLPPRRRVEDLLQEVDDDPTGIFWR